VFTQTASARPSGSETYQVQSRASGHHVSSSTSREKMAHMPMTKSTLKTAEPMMVPKPTEPLLAKKTPISDVNSSGADPPAAMSVAPATSSLMSNFSMMTSSAGTKNCWESWWM
jgi:hypothetical protein